MLPYLYQALNLLVIISVAVISRLLINRTYKDKAGRHRQWLAVLLFLLAWQLYVYLIASTGQLQDYSFPPKLVLMVVLPAFMIIAIFIAYHRRSAWLQATPPHWLVYFQSYRLAIEGLFVLSVSRGMLHANASIHGYNYDMLFAATAPLMGWLLYKRGCNAYTLARLWHYLGLGVIASIIVVIQLTIYAPELLGDASASMPPAFGAYPYVLVAGFLMPLAVFIHLLSLLQLKQMQEKGKNQPGRQTA